MPVRVIAILAIGMPIESVPHDSIPIQLEKQPTPHIREKHSGSITAVQQPPEIEALDQVKAIFAKHSLIESQDPTETAKIMDELIEDMADVDIHRFRRTVHCLLAHPVNGTAASISVLDKHHILIRFRNRFLRQLLPISDSVLNDILSKYGPHTHAKNKITLDSCEIRERQHNEGFFLAEWRNDDSGFFDFLYGNKRFFHIIITAMLAAGLLFEVILPFFDIKSELGQRLGAPMFVSGSVLMFERLGQWLDHRKPRLYWTVEHTRTTSILGPGSK